MNGIMIFLSRLFLIGLLLIGIDPATVSAQPPDKTMDVAQLAALDQAGLKQLLLDMNRTGGSDRDFLEEDVARGAAQLKILVELANRSEPYSCYDLGLAYYFGGTYYFGATNFSGLRSGLTFFKDRDQARALMERALSSLRPRAMLADAKAQYYISYIIPWLEGVSEYPFCSGYPEDRSPEGLTWRYRAALNGYPDAVTDWGWIVYSTCLLDEEARQSHVEMLSKIYRNMDDNGLGIKDGPAWFYLPKSNFDTFSFYWIQQGAFLGNSSLMEALGYCYEKGIGVRPDLADALKWYEYAQVHMEGANPDLDRKVEELSNKVRNGKSSGKNTPAAKLLLPVSPVLFGLPDSPECDEG